jgi:hypothetical protein
VPQAPIPHVNDSAMFSGRIVEGSLAMLNAWQAKQAEATAK